MSNEAADITQDQGILLQGARLLLGTIDETVEIGAANVARVRAGDAWYLVRQWPANAATQQVAQTGAALKAASTASPLFPQPVVAGDDWAVTVERQLVSAVQWLPGKPLARYGDFRTPDGESIDVPLPASAPAMEVILEAVAAMGQFHTATAGLVQRPERGAESLSSLQKRTERAWSQQRRVVGDKAANSPEIRRWLRCGNRVLPVAAEHMVQAMTMASTTTLIHGDLWPVNLLVDGVASEQRLTGITGWSTVHEASPLIDLAHLAVHTSNWSGAMAESVLGAYASTGSLSPTERRLLPAVAALDLVPRVGALLHHAFVDDRMIGHASQPVLRSGMKQLLMSLENLTDVLAPESEWDQRKFAEGRKQRGDRPAKKTGGTGTKPGRPAGSGRSRRG